MSKAVGNKSRYCIIFLIAIGALGYLNSLGNSFVWDDINLIANNESLGQSLGLKNLFFSPSQGFYRPLSYLSLIVDYKIWGRNPFGFHLSNIFFHLLNIMLLFSLAKRITRSTKVAFLSALLFAVHPVHTEAVTYIAGRSDLISVFFTLASFYLYLNFLSNDSKKMILFAALGLFIFALASRENVLIYPCLLLVYNFIFLKGSFLRKVKVPLAFFGLALAFLLFRQFLVSGELVAIELGTFTNIFKILLFYLKLLIYPLNLHMQHNLSESVFLLNLPFVLSAFIVLSLFFVIIKFNKEKYIRFGLFWFLVSLIPFLGILKINPEAQIAEHWLYLPSLGVFLIAGGLMAKINNRLIKGIVPIVFFSLIIITIQQNTLWRDDLTLYSYTLGYHPDSYKLHYNLGNAYLRRNEPERAQKQYRRALALKPDYAYALNNLSIALGQIDFAPSAFAQEVVTYFDHSVYSELLTRYVDDRGVDYKDLKKDPSLLYKYLKQTAELGQKTLKNFSPNEQKAFYINVYNALTLRAIIEHYPVKSIKQIPGVWDKLKFTVAGEKLTLNDIEHKILRPKFKDPRVHFTLVCAAQGCPRLRGKPYIAKNLDKILNREGNRFINDKTRNRLDKKRNILYLSSIFKWFKDDFDKPVEFISRYLPEGEAKFIKTNQPRIKYQYNWKLNEK